MVFLKSEAVELCLEKTLETPLIQPHKRPLTSNINTVHNIDLVNLQILDRQLKTKRDIAVLSVSVLQTLILNGLVLTSFIFTSVNSPAVSCNCDTLFK